MRTAIPPPFYLQLIFNGPKYNLYHQDIEGQRVGPKMLAPLSPPLPNYEHGGGPKDAESPSHPASQTSTPYNSMSLVPHGMLRFLQHPLHPTASSQTTPYSPSSHLSTSNQSGPPSPSTSNNLVNETKNKWSHAPPGADET